MKINNETEEGEKRINEFINGLIERNKVSEPEREAERARLEELIEQKMMNEILTALPDEAIEELKKSLGGDDEAMVDEILSKIAEAGIQPESITGKVFKDVEREYLGVENVESDEALIGVGEEE
jgi:hypothetical protein